MQPCVALIPDRIRFDRPGRSPRRYGRGPVELVVIVGLVGFAALFVMMALPRGRESARRAGCDRNLMQIGVGLRLYHQAAQHYPTVPPFGDPAGDTPIRAMLDSLSLPDLVGLTDPTKPPRPGQAPPKGARVGGLTCPSDPNATDRTLTTTISYRANTGADPSGLGGPFEPGRVRTAAEVEAADGLAFTAGFAERLVGDRRAGQPGPWNYAAVPGPIGDAPCPDAPPDRWRGDAGSSWDESGWRSTLYHHGLAPNAAPSCIADDGKSARIGASSAHPGRINVLLLDGSVRGVTPTVDPRVWRSMGTVQDPAR